MIQVMLDLETLGVNHNAVFLSIGAVAFDTNTFEEVATFKTNILLESALNAGLKIEAATLRWWLTQRPEIMAKMFEGETPDLSKALFQFGQFYSEVKAIGIWGNSAAFDIELIKDGFRACKMPIPWHYRDEFCYRTLYTLFSTHKFGVLPVIPYPMAAHDPIVDCRYQIANLKNIFEMFVYKHIEEK